MKKLLYVALAAMMLISCDPNAPKIPSKDNKMLDNLSLNMLSLLGEKKKNVISTLESYGFQDVTYLGEAPARLGKPAQEAEESNSYSFFYGNMDVYEEAMEEDDIEILTDYLIEKKELAAFMFVSFYDNKLVRINVDYYASSEIKNIAGMYTKFSKNMFLALDEDKEWTAHLGELEDYVESDYALEDLKSYTLRKRDKFEEDLVELECPFARELGSDNDSEYIRQYLGLYYGDYGMVEKDYEGLANGYFTADLIEVTPEPEP